MTEKASATPAPRDWRPPKREENNLSNPMEGANPSAPRPYLAGKGTFSVEWIINTPPGLVSPDASVLIMRFQESASYGEGNLLALYTAAERAEILEMKTELRRQEKLAGKLAVKFLACDLMTRWFNEKAEPSLIEVLASKAPVQVGAPMHSHLDLLLKSLHFSISHTDGVVCAAAGRHPVGIDVEKIQPMTPEMIREIGGSMALEEPLPLMAFTGKESVLKAAGIGLRQELSDVQLDEIIPGKPIEATLNTQRYQVVSVLEHNCIFSLACWTPGMAEAAESVQPARKEVVASVIQEAMWYLDQLEGFGATHTVGRTLRLRGELNVQALFRSIQYIVNRHEALRTVFREEDGQCRVDVLAHLKVPLVFESFRHLPAESALSAAKSRCADEMLLRFDLAHGPLLRCTLFDIGDNDYMLLLIFHHAIIDASALTAFRLELARCYQEYREGRTPVLPPLSFQYSDYARQQRKCLTPEKTRHLLDYWCAKLEGSPFQLELPWDARYPPHQTFQSGSVMIPLSSRSLHALRDLRSKENVSLFVTFLAAFQILLKRLSNEDDVVVGIPFVDRNFAKMNPLIGCFVNMLPLRLDLSGNPRFRDFLSRVQVELKEAMAHHELPFPTLVKELGARRQTAGPPIIQTSILLTNDAVEGVELPGLQQDYCEIPAGGTAYDLSLFINVNAFGGLVRFEYNSGLFSEETVRRMAGIWQRLLEGIVTNPDEAIDCLPLLDERGRRQLLEDWNKTEASFEPVACIHELFEAQVERTPMAPAVIFEDTLLSYQELNSCANRLARRLRKLGVEPDVPVALCVERSLEMVVGMLAILKAGGAYVPIDPEYPAERVNFMLGDLQSPLVLTLARIAGEFPVLNGDKTLLLDGWAHPDRMAGPDNANLPGTANRENLAYLIYTSGSTGKPKGVRIPHRAVVNHMQWMQSVFPMDGTDAVLQKTPFSFDASIWEFHAPLAAGSRLVLARPGGHQDLSYLIEILQREHITTLQLVPIHLQLLMDERGFSKCRTLRRVFCGGEALSADLVKAFCNCLDAELCNLYGPTEVTIDSVFFSIDRRHLPEVVPLGRPVANVRAYILDPLLQPVPIGVAGELVLGGIQVGKGYHHRPDLTSERFRSDLFRPDDRAALYKTGDRVRYRADGVIEFLGRLDRQVKLRGYRIELEEIEATLARHPGLRQSVVTIREDTPGNKRLVAYGIPVEPLDPPAIAELRCFLQETLPDYMIPATFVMLEKLPLSPAGKIDRCALPAPAWELMGDETNTAAPRNLTEEILADIWCDVLGLKQVGIHDNFFDRGGHSLLGVKLVTQIRAAFQSDLPLRNLFQAPTIAELAKMVESPGGSDDSRVYLMEVQKGRSGTPLFFMPGGGGGEIEFMVYARMMRRLGSDLPVYGFRVWGLDGRTKPLNSVKEMATAFLAELQAVQGRGPYYLAGECLGGIVAFELAQQLHERGEQVAFLGMLDTACPSLRSFLQTFREKFRLRMNQCWERIMRLPASRRLAGLPGAVGETMTHLGNDLGYVRSHPLSTDEPVQRQYRVKRVSYTYSRSLLRYRPKPYSGKITMLLTDDFAGLSEPPAAWGEWARGGVEMHRVMGNHQDYVRDHALMTGQKLGECLSQARLKVNLSGPVRVTPSG